jgi:hypothetical protein
LRARVFVPLIVLLAAVRAQAQPALLDVPFVSQSEALCGGAAAAMVLRYWGERGVTAETFAPLVDRSAAGISTTTLVAELVRRGWNATAVAGTDLLLNGELTAGRPVIALIEDRPRTFHYIVVVAVTAETVVLHDPARAPFRVMSRADFERRWRATAHWMAVITPPAERTDTAGPPVTRAAKTDSGSCAGVVQRGVALAQTNNLAGAEQTLAGALGCPGPAALRELAGVRALQRRWDEAATLATEALAIDPADDYTWRLLGTSRFLLDQPLPALEAWNHAGEPALDLIQVDGLLRTRQRPVERLIGLEPGVLITAGAFRRSERALRDLPAAASTRLELRPPVAGSAVVRAVIAERPPLPRDPWIWGAIGANVAIARTVALTTGSVTGGGESLALEWRFWRQRPRLAASFRSPAPWSGLWGVDVYGESQEFDGILPTARRRGGRLVAGRWLTPALRLEVRGGADRWTSLSMMAGSAGAGATLTSPFDRLTLRTAIDGWAGDASFASSVATVSATTARRGSHPGVAAIATVSAALVSRKTPLDLWPAGDTGQARPFLLRAHPVLDAGRLRVDQLGRRLLQASGEAQRWWNGPGFSRIGAALFVDAARTANRFRDAGAAQQVDIGAGIRLSSALMSGGIALDIAHGLRDGQTAFSARYVAAGW